MILYETQLGRSTGRIFSKKDGFSQRRADQRKSLIEWFLNFFKEVFLPSGYPNSVSSDYLSYQIW